MRGGCRARAPPDVSQAEMEVTWEGGQGHQESRGALPGARKSRGACDHFLSCFTHPQQPRSARALTLHLPPGLTVCSGRPRSGWGGGLSPGGGVSPSWGQSQPPPFSTGSGPLPWEPRHWQMLLPPSLFHPFVRMRPTCAGRLCVSGAQSLEKVGGACRSFLPVTSVCKVIGPSTRFVWVRGA